MFRPIEHPRYYNRNSKHVMKIVLNENITLQIIALFTQVAIYFGKSKVSFHYLIIRLDLYLYTDH